jgi:hypothetical protein
MLLFLLLAVSAPKTQGPMTKSGSCPMARP